MSNVDEFVSTYSDIFNHVANWTDTVEIADMTDLDRSSDTPPSVRTCAEMFLSQTAARGIAVTRIIIAPEDYSFGLARIFATYASFRGKHKVTVVRSVKEAAAQIGASATTIADLIKFAQRPTP